LALIALVLAAALPAAARAAEGEIVLFNGKNFDGWTAERG
jgi:hypothetical protein